MKRTEEKACNSAREEREGKGKGKGRRKEGKERPRRLRWQPKREGSGD